LYEKSVQWNKLLSLNKAIYVGEQVCIRWRRTDAYYTAKLTFSHDFPVEVWGAYYIRILMVLIEMGRVVCLVGLQRDSAAVL